MGDDVVRTLVYLVVLLIGFAIGWLLAALATLEARLVGHIVRRKGYVIADINGQRCVFGRVEDYCTANQSGGAPCFIIGKEHFYLNSAKVIEGASPRPGDYVMVTLKPATSHTISRIRQIRTQMIVGYLKEKTEW